MTQPRWRVTKDAAGLNIRDERAWNVNVVLSGVTAADARLLASLLIEAADWAERAK